MDSTSHFYDLLLHILDVIRMPRLVFWRLGS